MRQKFIDKIYMRDVTEKSWYVEDNKEIDGYIALKYIKEIPKPIKAFCNGKEYLGLDKGFSILEYVPKNRNYNCRVFFDSLDRPLCYYFDINNGTGIENEIPWYDDLYLDVTMECPTITEMGYYIRLDDEKEFKTAKKSGLVDEETYAKGYAVAKSLMSELREQTNDLVIRSQKDLYRIKNILNK